MPLPAPLPPLLILQDRDKRRRDLAAQLQAVPGEIAVVEGRIAKEKAAIEEARAELRTLEARKKVLETEIGSAEQKVAKYRTQQMEVRKNDEYRALGLEIEHTQGVIGKLEEEELGVLYAIEEAKKKFAAAEDVLKTNIAGHEAKLADLRARTGVLTGQHQEAEQAYAAARGGATEPALRAYDRACLRQKLPVVVPVHGGKCSGCHLKLSGDVETQVRAREAALVTCDHCGRLIWWE